MINKYNIIVMFIFTILNASDCHSEVIPNLPYERMEVVDSHGEKVVYYITHPDKPAPLALLIQRAGCTPLFEKNSDGAYVGEIGVAMKKAADNRLTLLAVEKNHTIPSSQIPKGKEDTSDGCPLEFIEQDTLDFRLDNLLTALHAAKSLPWVLPGPILTVGVGDGAILAAAVARFDGDITNVAQVTAAGAPGGWYFIDGIIMSRNINAYDKEKKISDEEDWYGKIINKKNSAEISESGYSYKYLYSYISHFPLDDMANNKAKIYMLNSYDDQVNSLSSMEMMFAYLVANGRDVTTRRVMGYDADRSKKITQIVSEYERIVDWFFHRTQSPLISN